MPLWKNRGVSKHNMEPGNVYAGACENLKENVDLKKSHTQQLLPPPHQINVREFKITWYFSARGFS